VLDSAAAPPPPVVGTGTAPEPAERAASPSPAKPWRPYMLRRATGAEPRGVRGPTPKYDRSLLRALHATYWVRWWSAGLASLVSNSLKTTAPLVNKALLTWLEVAYAYYNLDPARRGGLEKPRGIGYGIGLTFVLFAMLELASLVSGDQPLSRVVLTLPPDPKPVHAQSVDQMSLYAPGPDMSPSAAMTTGLSVRTGTIGTIFRKSLRLSGRARMEHSVGQITTMISTDTSRLDRSSAFFHKSVHPGFLECSLTMPISIWIGPIQIIIGIGLLVNNVSCAAMQTVQCSLADHAAVGLFGARWPGCLAVGSPCPV
jgi:ATP-binding cassette subfamily C (CFTR/MRP) protein 1